MKNLFENIEKLKNTASVADVTEVLMYAAEDGEELHAVQAAATNYGLTVDYDILINGHGTITTYGIDGSVDQCGNWWKLFFYYVDNWEDIQGYLEIVEEGFPTLWKRSAACIWNNFFIDIDE